ncbi:DivIVA domain-containing protein [Dyadobacter arcticus]|uniref:Cell division initiation protein n=1 Tax=Dyadobacter arcticus TaxID=1078754 RepID=A0ABX0UP67_9BACT|nr:DivIVA domain-containing protein [Dyadobacter arcticus]NIJ53460.1 cell division initiation protein [Dyadobacter arcticus]
MKISAIEIRKHTFEKIFRGYDPDEVDAFLNSLSQEWERFSSENSLLKMQLEYAEKELSKLKDIESTLFRTLKAAEDTSRLIEKEAHEMAEKTIEESRVTANDLVTEAEARTSQVINQTEERLRLYKEEFATEIKKQERDFKAIENFRDNLIVQLSSLANNTIDTVERFEQKYDKESVLNKMEEVKQHVSEIEIPKKPLYQSEGKVAEEMEEDIPVPDFNVVMQDEKPEVLFEVVDTQNELIEKEEILIEAEPEEQEIMPVEEPEPEPIAEPVEEKIQYRVKEPVKSAADEMNEVLAEMHKTAEKARETSTAGNRPRETNQPRKTGGGGSFFDQI